MKTINIILVLLLLLAGAQPLLAQSPVAQFSASTTSGCDPLTVTFRDESTNNPTGWNWDLGNGQLSTARNPTVTYRIPGVYTVTLVATNARGSNRIIKTNYIQVFPSANVSFRASTNIACRPATITFTDLSNGNGANVVSWLWEFGDGTTSTERNPTKVFDNLGYYNVSLTVTTSNGCTTTASRARYIRIIGGVTPNFDFARVGSCDAPVNVNFINQTSGPGDINYNWTLGNGATSTAKDPTTVYNAFGTYNVKLVTTSSYGCRDSITKPITLNANNAGFTLPDTICPKKEWTLTNTANPAPVSALWDFGDGTTSIDINPVKVYNNPGTYTIRLTNQFADCSSVFTRQVTVADPAAPEFTVDKPIGCKTPHSVQFRHQVAGATQWLWDFGDGNTSTEENPTHIYNTEGSFDVSLTVTTANGCPATAVKTSAVQVQQLGNISVTGLPDSGCAPLTITPRATLNTIDSIVLVEWEFESGSIVTGENPSHTYPAPGIYEVGIRVTTAGGCFKEMVLPTGVKVGTKPVADFTSSSPSDCAGDSVSFVSTANPATAWRWDFGDGSRSTEQNPVHLYLDTGWMSVTLIAYNNGCADTMVKPNFLYRAAPVARFNMEFDCANRFLVRFRDSSITDASHGVTRYLWNFGDGTTSTDVNPTHTYTSEGRFRVSLTVTDDLCTHTFIQAIDIYSINADITINKPQVCRRENFLLTVTGADQFIEDHIWHIETVPDFFGNETAEIRLPNNGVYDAGVSLIDNHGCTTRIDKPNLIRVVGSTADFTVASSGGCVDAQVTLTDASTPAGTITQWIFDYGDSTIDTLSAPPFVHVYDKVGVYDITLRARDTAGCVTTVTKNALVNITRPQVNFSSRDTLFCPGVGVRFHNTSVGFNLTYRWDFGDGSSSTDAEPVHIYNGPDSVYTVKLIATDQTGCVDSLVRTEYIRIVAPKPIFTVKDTSTICPPLETKFFSSSLDFERLRWDFGDGNSSTLDTTTNFYDTFGSYTATLTVIGYGGCERSASTTVNVYNPASTVFTYSPLEACNELEVTFNVTPPPNTWFHIVFGDGTRDSSQSRTITHLYSRPNIYSPSVILFDSLGCQVSVGGRNRITVNGILPILDISQDEFCDTGRVVFQDYSLDGADSITNRIWNFGDGSAPVSGPADNVSHFYSQPGTYYITETLNTARGCTNTITDTIRVFRTPEPLIIGPSDICVGNIVQFSASTAVPDSAVNWRWTYGNGETSTLPTITGRFNEPGVATVTLLASNKLGCSGDTSMQVNIWPLPTIENQPEVVIPVGGGTVLPVSYSNNVSTWTWTPADNLSCTNCATPYANPRFTTKYNISVVDSNGCRATSSIVVRVICENRNYFVPNTFSPNNDGQNDVFYPRGTGLDRIQSMRIFNRWGELVFERKNFVPNSPSEGWNGIIRGKPAASDAYVYVIEVICDNAQIVQIKGNVTLIR